MFYNMIFSCVVHEVHGKLLLIYITNYCFEYYTI
jgi:hypothetical protein